MKNGKRPTKRQAIFMQKNGYNPFDWYVVKDTSMEMWIVARKAGHFVVMLPKNKEERE